MEYRTITTAVTAQIEEKRSRFRCDLTPVETEDDARRAVEQARKEFWDARHHCSAFILGPEGRVERSSDDGEPSGTAGAPMLDVLRGSGLTDVVAVVTRWFGGTLLGAGGLVRAYSEAVRAAIDVATPRTMTLTDEWAITVPHADAGRVESALRTDGVEVVDHIYDAAVTLHLLSHDGHHLGAMVSELLQHDVEPQHIGHRWVRRD
ncbi:IMPACT family protein [Propioniferax innocua]|uniref:Putative YigZ family protein n=1 Tax=Propioniferax innocua TaxID=1753 RepID=A0A542ZDG8_9ACTN|nr:YigZ family protein [Propioniferax innocua]TQL58341.1 putative YigZ family protein [Propioniferax innocua]